jgi:hypothetical protein
MSLRSSTAALLLVAGLDADCQVVKTLARGRRMRLVAVCGFVVATHAAGLLAWAKALRGERNPIWEPTRRAA